MTRLGVRGPNFTYPSVAPTQLFPTVRQAIEAEASGFDTLPQRTIRRVPGSIVAEGTVTTPTGLLGVRTLAAAGIASRKGLELGLLGSSQSRLDP